MTEPLNSKIQMNRHSHKFTVCGRNCSPY